MFKDYNVVAFDLGINLGVCTSIKGEIKSFSIDCRNLAKKKFSGDIYDAIKSTIKSYIIKAKADFVVYEKLPFATYTYATQAHGAYIALLGQAVKEASVELKRKKTIPIFHCFPAEAKKALTGSARATKQAMCYYASIKTFTKVDDDNAADSIGIMFYFKNKIYPSLTKKDKEGI